MDNLLNHFLKPAKSLLKIRVNETIHKKWAKIDKFLLVKQILLAFTLFSANLLVTQDSDLE